VRRHRSANLRLLAYDHGLEALRRPEPEAARHGRWTRLAPLLIDRLVHKRLEWLTEPVQVMADFVDSALLGLGQFARGLIERLLLEEEPNLQIRFRQLTLSFHIHSKSFSPNDEK
jgi:hypothetical protein